MFQFGKDLVDSGSDSKYKQVQKLLTSKLLKLVVSHLFLLV